MIYSIKAGTTDVSVVLRIIDSTDGTPETGVVFNTSGIDLEYRRELAASVDITEATLAALTTAHADGGFLHIGNGYYRLDLPDAAVATGATGVLVHGTVTGMVVIGCYIQLVAYDPFDSVRQGMSALPNAAAEAAGGLYTRGTGAGQINQPANGMIDGNVVRWLGTAASTPTVAGVPNVNVKTWNDLTTVALPLIPTTAGRTLDVSTGGEAGVDWANVGSPTTTVGLSGTTVKTATDVETDTADIQTRLPAALVSGRMDSSTGAMASGVLTATAIAADAITDAKVASDVTISSVTGSVGSVTGNVGGNVVGSVGSVAAAVGLSAGDSPVMQSGTATAGGGSTITIQTALGADSLPVGSVIKITSGTGANQARVITAYVNATKVVTVDRAWTTNPDATSVYSILYAENTALGSSLKVSGVVLTDTVTTYTGNTPQTGDAFARLGAPAGASVSADVAAVKVDTAAIKAKTDNLPADPADASDVMGAAAAIQADTDDIQARLPAALVGGRMDVSVGAMASGVLTATAIAADAITDAKVASDVTIASVTGTVGSVTGNVGGNVTGSVGSVTGLTAATVHADLDDIQARLPAALVSGRMDSSVGAMAANVLTATAINADAFTAAKFASDVGAEFADAVWDEAIAGHAGAGSTGLALAGATAPTAAAVADAVWEEAIADHSGTSGSTAEALAAAGSAGDPWITALPGAYSAGQAGYIVGTNVNATVSSRATQVSVDDLPTNAELATALGTADDAVLAQVALVKAKTDNLPADPADASDIASSLATIGGYIDTETGSILTAVNAIKEYADNTVVRGTVSGTSPTTTTFTTSALSPAGVAADQFKGRIIVFDNDTTTTALRGQATDITASSAASNPLLTFTALTTAPQSGDSFSIV